MALDRYLARKIHQETENHRQEAYDVLDEVPLPFIFDYLRAKGYEVKLKEPAYDERKFN